MIQCPLRGCGAGGATAAKRLTPVILMLMIRVVHDSLPGDPCPCHSGKNAPVALPGLLYPLKRPIANHAIQARKNASRARRYSTRRMY